MGKLAPEYTFRTVESAAIRVNIPQDLLSMQDMQSISALRDCIWQAIPSFEKATAIRNNKILFRMKYGRALPDSVSEMEARRTVATRELTQVVSLTLKPTADPEYVWHDLRYIGDAYNGQTTRKTIYWPSHKVRAQPVETLGDVYRVMFGTRKGNAAFLKAHPECNFGS